MKDLWLGLPDGEFVVEDLGDCAGVFCVRTGNTHIIDQFPREILLCLSSEAPRSTSAISQAIAQLLGDSEDDWIPRVHEVLQRLEVMRLVERVPA